MKNNSSNFNIIISGVSSGLFEHYIGLLPRSILDHYQSDNLKYFKSYRHVFNKMYRDNGISTFYKLNYPMILSISFAHIWLFKFYELHKQTKSNYESLFYCSVSKIGHDILMIPGDTIRMRNNISGIHSNIIIKDIYNKQKFFGFFKSSPITLLMNLPSGLIDFTIIKYCINNYGNDNHKIFLYGGISGIISSVITNPLDIIKTNIQIHGIQNKYSNNIIKDNSVSCICKNIISNNGYKGFFRGTMLRSFQTSLCFGTYEYISSKFT